MRHDNTEHSASGKNESIFNHPMVKLNDFLLWMQETLPPHSLSTDEIEECKILEYCIRGIYSYFTAYILHGETTALVGTHRLSNN